MAEKFTLQQTLRDGTAVDRRELSRGAGAVLVNGAGDQSFALSTLAADEHHHVLQRDPANGVVNLLHRRATADQGIALGLLPLVWAVSATSTETCMKRRIFNARATSSRILARTTMSGARLDPPENLARGRNACATIRRMPPCSPA